MRNGPIIALRPGTRVLDFLYCNKSPRDTLSVIMLPSDRASSVFPPLFFRSFLFAEAEHRLAVFL